MRFFLQTTTNGLLLGGLYALVAAGLSLVFGVMRVVNVAHGDFMALGATLTYVGVTTLGVPFWLSMPASVLVVLAVGTMTERLFLERIRASDEMMSLMMLFGVGTALANVQAATIGARYFSVPVWTGSVDVGGVFVSKALAVSFGVAVVMSCALLWILKRTDLGRSIRATAMAPNLAAAVGVNTAKVRLIVFGIGIAFAGGAGGLLVTSQGMNPLSGPVFLLIAFTASVLGGLGSVGGALIGSLAIGLVEVWAGGVIDSQFAQLAIYAFFVLIVLVRPTGLFGLVRQ